MDRILEQCSKNIFLAIQGSIKDGTPTDDIISEPLLMDVTLKQISTPHLLAHRLLQALVDPGHGGTWE